MRSTLLLLILAAPLAAGAVLAQTEPEAPQGRPGDLPLPGYWEITTKYSSVIGGESTDRRCYGPADVHKLAQPCNHHHICVYSTNDVRDGHIVLKGKWFSKEKDGTTGGEVANFAGSGSYTPESLTASAKGNYDFLGMSVPATAELSARRLSATCPPDAKKG